MRELPVALSTGIRLDNLDKKSTHSLSHTPKQAKTKKGEKTESVCVLIKFCQESENEPARVIISISTSHPILIFFMPLPALSACDILP